MPKDWKMIALILEKYLKKNCYVWVLYVGKSILGQQFWVSVFFISDNYIELYKCRFQKISHYQISKANQRNYVTEWYVIQ